MGLLRGIFPVWVSLAFLTCSVPAQAQNFHDTQSPMIYDVPAAQYRTGWTADDSAHQATINRSFHDAIELAQLAAHSLTNSTQPHRLFRSYFGTTDLVWVEVVHSVFANISSATLGEASDLLKDVYFRKKDSRNLCEQENREAYTDSYIRNHANDSDIVICDPAGYERRELHFQRASCDDLGEAVDRGRMDTMARLVLHEFMHHPQVGGSVRLVGQMIEDRKVTDDSGVNRPAYGPLLCRDLASRRGPKSATKNADSYAWFAQVSRIVEWFVQ